MKRISLASNWIEDKITDGRQVLDISLGANEKNALSELIDTLRSYIGSERGRRHSTTNSNKAFEIARNNGVQPKDFFRLIYKLILHIDRGPVGQLCGRFGDSKDS